MCLHCLQKAAAAADPIVEGCRAVLYADFLRPGGPEAARYEEVTDTSKLLQAVEEALGEYNAQVRVQGSWLLPALRALWLRSSACQCVHHGMC